MSRKIFLAGGPLRSGCCMAHILRVPLVST
jgi:hypothetical protein